MDVTLGACSLHSHPTHMRRPHTLSAARLLPCCCCMGTFSHFPPASPSNKSGTFVIMYVSACRSSAPLDEFLGVFLSHCMWRIPECILLHFRMRSRFHEITNCVRRKRSQGRMLTLYSVFGFEVFKVLWIFVK